MAKRLYPEEEIPSVESMEELLISARQSREYHERIEMRSIVMAHDKWGLTFRQIAGMMDYPAHSWVYKMYQKGKLL